MAIPGILRIGIAAFFSSYVSPMIVEKIIDRGSSVAKSQLQAVAAEAHAGGTGPWLVSRVKSNGSSGGAVSYDDETSAREAFQSLVDNGIAGSLMTITGPSTKDETYLPLDASAPSAVSDSAVIVVTSTMTTALFILVGMMSGESATAAAAKGPGAPGGVAS